MGLGEIFMRRLEEELFTSNPQLKACMSYWFRYMEDIFCLWTGIAESLQAFLDVLNDLYPSIRFTVEFGGKKINFLDITISIVDNCHTFEVFRKPTSTDILLNASSLCPTSHKLAALHSLIHRSISLPQAPPEFDKEVATIRHLANVNGLSNVDTDGLIRRKLIRRSLDSSTSLPQFQRSRHPRRVSVPYMEKASALIQKAMKPHNLILSKLKNPPKYEKRGVHLLPCNDCSAVYIGETGRQFCIILHEYLDKLPPSAFAR